MRSLVFILLTFIVGATAFGLGSRRPSYPQPQPTPLKQSGTVFSMELSGSSYADGQDLVQRFASRSCESGEARRISSWKHLPMLEARFPGNCRDFEGKKYCTDETVTRFYSVRAKFRCE